LHESGIGLLQKQLGFFRATPRLRPLSERRPSLLHATVNEFIQILLSESDVHFAQSDVADLFRPTPFPKCPAAFRGQNLVPLQGTSYWDVEPRVKTLG
jgi:hypothetical protein